MITPSYAKGASGTSTDARRKLEGIERDLRRAREHVDDTGDPAAARAALKLARNTAAAVKDSAFSLAPDDRGRVLESLSQWVSLFSEKLHAAEEATAPAAPHSRTREQPDWLRQRWAWSGASIRSDCADESRAAPAEPQRTRPRPRYTMNLLR